jgi:hypothetical protein
VVVGAILMGPWRSEILLAIGGTLWIIGALTAVRW